MNDYLFFGYFNSFYLFGWMFYFFVAVLIKRRGTVSLKLLKVNLGLLKSPLRFLIPAFCIAGVIPLLRLPEKIYGFISHFIQTLHIHYVNLCNEKYRTGHKLSYMPPLFSIYHFYPERSTKTFSQPILSKFD